LFLRIIILILLSLVFTPWQADIAFAQAEIVETSVDYEFGNFITFNAKYFSDIPIETGVLFFQAENDTHTNIGLAAVELLDGGYYQLSYTHDITDYPVRAFSQVDYRFELLTPEGETFVGQTNEFYYEDDRFEWMSLEEAPFSVHWHTGDIIFGQAILDAAQNGLIQAQKILPLEAPEALDIYVYEYSEDLKTALLISSDNWIAGHADPDLGVIVTTLSPKPEQEYLMQSRIPHELMHVLLFKDRSTGYSNYPTWFNEGLASITELYPNPDYRIALEDAIENDNLLPMTSLCEAFPREASIALLAYAQAASFTDFLLSTYGTTGLNELKDIYANGIDCERGVQDAYGLSLDQLERQWQRNGLEANPYSEAFGNFMPWLIILILAIFAPSILIIRKLNPLSYKNPN